MNRRRLPCHRTPASPALWVRKLDADGREVYRYPATLLWRGTDSITVAAIFQMPNTMAGNLLLAQGDCFVETYFVNRWYNILAVYAHDSGRLRGWYVNIGETVRLSGREIAYRDLALDVIVTAKGRLVVLDEEEFAALPLADAERRRALAALHTVRQRFERLCHAVGRNK